jgi:Uma2 family endonuclease
VLEIPEYWIVDPLQSKLTVLILVEGWYESTEFTHQDLIQSQTFADLRLTAEQVLRADLG